MKILLDNPSLYINKARYTWDDAYNKTWEQMTSVTTIRNYALIDCIKDEYFDEIRIVFEPNKAVKIYLYFLEDGLIKVAWTNDYPGIFMIKIPEFINCNEVGVVFVDGSETIISNSKTFMEYTTREYIEKGTIIPPPPVTHPNIAGLKKCELYMKNNGALTKMNTIIKKK